MNTAGAEARELAKLVDELGSAEEVVLDIEEIELVLCDCVAEPEGICVLPELLEDTTSLFFKRRFGLWLTFKACSRALEVSRMTKMSAMVKMNENGKEREMNMMEYLHTEMPAAVELWIGPATRSTI